jgi:glycosyltransferase involved in cell wall biosynthesis
MVDLLARGLVERGHIVDLYAHEASNTAGQLISWNANQVWRNALALGAKGVSGSYDVVNCFGPAKLVLPTLLLRRPTLISFHSPIPIKTVRAARRIGGKSAFFSSVSDSMRPGSLGFAWWRTLHNGIDTAIYEAKTVPNPDGPFVFLGRIEESKGPHLAIEIAQRTGRQLLIAGNVNPDNRQYFSERIAPQLSEPNVKYIGVVDDRQKNELLGSAHALIAPILWDEPFGLVVVEAMACGTPVLGFRRASFPEIIDDGSTGVLGDDLEELCARAREIHGIDRAKVRQAVEERFSAARMTDAHISYYRHIHDAVTRPNQNRGTPNA